MTMVSKVLATFAILAITITNVSPFPVADSSSLRYIPGDDLNSITMNMKYDSGTVWSLGSDGVLRTFANNLTVLDYHQLDQGQVKTLASGQLAQLQASGREAPSQLEQLAESPVDGRLITDINELLNPKEKPNVPPRPDITPRSFEISELESLSKRQNCPGNPTCESLADCQVYGCQACFFPNGPPAGICFLT